MNEILAVSAPGGQPLSLPTLNRLHRRQINHFHFPFGRFLASVLAPTSHKGVWTPEATVLDRIPSSL